MFFWAACKGMAKTKGYERNGPLITLLHRFSNNDISWVDVHDGQVEMTQPKHPLRKRVEHLETQPFTENAAFLPALSIYTYQRFKGIPFDNFFKQEGEDISILIWRADP